MDNKSLQNNDLNVYDILLYLGGFTLFLGFYYFIGVSWSSTHPILQVIFTLIMSLLLIFLGLVIIKKQNSFKLGFPLIFIALFLLPVGGYVLLHNLNDYLKLGLLNIHFYIFAFLLSAVVFNAIYLILRSTTVLLFTLIYYSLFYWLFIFNYTLDFDNYNISYGILTLASMFIGASGLFLALYFREKRKFIYVFLSLFSINFLLAGGLFFNFFSEANILTFETNIPWILFYPIFNFLILNIAIRFKDLINKIFSIVYLVVYIFYILFKYLDSEYYFATILLILGSSLLGTGYYQYSKKIKLENSSNKILECSLNNDVSDKSIQNSNSEKVK